MKKRGNRIIYETVSGKIIHQTGEALGETEFYDDWQGLSYIEIPHGAIDYFKRYVASVDVKTKKAIIKSYVVQKTEQELFIEKMKEEMEMLKLQVELGGIL
ncbi:hypothetical protein C3943_08090 [Lysinibacillus sp. B2A1]|nr:hypothetical protein C3943_08090 [Lysinibacillus sp. B2A1]